MKIATEQQIIDACMMHSATDASRYLASTGVSATSNQCDSVIRVLIATGLRDRKPTRSIEPDADRVLDVSALAARAGCESLLRRHLTTGFHWIHDPAKMAVALSEAGMVS